MIFIKFVLYETLIEDLSFNSCISWEIEWISSVTLLTPIHIKCIMTVLSFDETTIFIFIYTYLLLFSFFERHYDRSLLWLSSYRLFILLPPDDCDKYAIDFPIRNWSLIVTCISLHFVFKFFGDDLHVRFICHFKTTWFFSLFWKWSFVDCNFSSSIKFILSWKVWFLFQRIIWWVQFYHIFPFFLLLIFSFKV